MLTAEQIGNELNRSIKLAIDSGEASTIDAARAIFEGYKLGIRLGPDIASSPTKQVALLMAINTARRCFLGGVEVEIREGDANLLVPWRDCQTIDQAIIDLGGKTGDAVGADLPTIVLGDVNEPIRNEFALRATFDGHSLPRTIQGAT